MCPRHPPLAPAQPPDRSSGTQSNFTAKERTRFEDAFGAWELKTDPYSEDHGFVAHQDIPQLVRALGYALSNEVRAVGSAAAPPRRLAAP